MNAIRCWPCSCQGHGPCSVNAAILLKIRVEACAFGPIFSCPPVLLTSPVGTASPFESSAEPAGQSIGLYDAEGVLRCATPHPADCLAYAELFGLDLSRCSLVTLT
jgi:hypothetical protein